MNKTKIEWTDYSWNPITGCKHGCWYCYAHKLFTRFHRSFEPTFHPERLDELKKLKKPAKIFVCSVADIFAHWTPREWGQRVIDEVQKPEYNHLTFQLLTKAPENMGYYHINPQPNIWIGVTITGQDEINEMNTLVEGWEGNKFVSFEPLLEPINPNRAGFKIYFPKIGWVIIGRLTGSSRVKLEKEWVQTLIEECRANGIPVFVKDNVNWEEKIQEFPKSPLKGVC